MQVHEKYMQRALDLAKLGISSVAPNPMVGAVIVHDKKIIGEGYHKEYGEPHAEVYAIASVKNKELLKESTLYVTLEPCAHYGKTPPCAELIVKSKIPTVYIGCRDSYKEVDGKGIELLRAKGIHVEVGILEDRCKTLNKRFFTFHEKNRPYVILKWAQDQQGFMDIDRSNGNKGNHWITAPETQVLTHKWRSEEAAILVGNKTVINDNPSLNCRAMKGKDPIRIVIDQKLKLDYENFNIGDHSVKTYILTEEQTTDSENLEFINPSSFSIHGILTKLHTLKIQSVIIEGGKSTLNKFIASGIWDEARILEGKNSCGKGKRSPLISGELIAAYSFGKDTIKIVANA